MEIKVNSVIVLKTGFLLVVREVMPPVPPSPLCTLRCEVYATTKKKNFLGFANFWYNMTCWEEDRWLGTVTRIEPFSPFMEIDRIMQ